MYKYTVYLYRYTYTPTNINVTSLVPQEAEERGGIDGQTHTYSKLGESSKPTGKGAGESHWTRGTFLLGWQLYFRGRLSVRPG